MPKLAAKVAKKVASTEVKDFSALEAGVYTGQLMSVEAKNSSKGNPMWVWEFGELEDIDGEPAPGRLWLNTVLPTDDIDSSWVFAQAFAAFGYTPDSDTDEIVGDRCGLQVSKGEISSGARKGQMGNSIDKLLPLDGIASNVDGGSDASGEDVF